MTEEEIKKRSDEVYERFFALYKPGSHLMAESVTQLIKKRRYSYPTMRRFVAALDWFEANYGSAAYKMEFIFRQEFMTGEAGMYLDILDDQNSAFAEYKFNKRRGGYFAENQFWATSALIANLEKLDAFNEKKHYVVGVE